MTRWSMRALAAAALAALLIGCDIPAASEDSPDWWVEDVDVNGRQVPCVFWIDSSLERNAGSGMSCDWEPR